MEKIQRQDSSKQPKQIYSIEVLLSRLINLEKNKQKAILKKDAHVIEKINSIEKNIIKKIYTLIQNSSDHVLKKNQDIINNLKNQWSLNKELLMNYRDITGILSIL